MNVLGMQGRSRERHPAVLTEAMDLSKCAFVLHGGWPLAGGIARVCSPSHAQTCL